MNSLACPLLVLSFGQVAAPESFPEPPTTLQAPPVTIHAEDPPAPSAFRVSDVEPPKSPAVPNTQPYEPFPEPPVSQPPNEPRASVPRQVSAPTDNEPVAPVNAHVSIELARQILSEAIESSSVRGPRVPLVKVLNNGGGTTQSRGIDTYWQLCVAIARGAFAEHEAQFLKQLPRPQTRNEDARWQAHIARASARQSEASLTVLQWQERLAEVLPAASEDVAVPTDIPFVGVYRTRIDQLFVNQPAPWNLRRINRALPYQLDLISRRAESIGACERVLAEARDSYTRGGVSVVGPLDAMKDLSYERGKFLDAILAYNQSIAEYSLAVVRPGVPAATLLGTLIRTETGAQPALLADAGVRRASAEEPVADGEPQTGFSTQSPARTATDPYRASARSFEPGARSYSRRVTIDRN